MTIKARYSVELRGHIYRKGETADWDGAVTPRIAANFTAADGTPLKADEAGGGAKDAHGADGAAGAAEAAPGDAEIVRRTVDALKRDGVRRALEAAGVAYSNKSSTEYLARLLLVARGEIAE